MPRIKPGSSSRAERCVEMKGIEPGSSSRAERGEEVQRKRNANDAISYLKEVKEIFKDEEGKYERFLEVMKAFKSQSLDTDSVIADVKELFKGHNNLILGFNAFLPERCHITVIEEEPKPIDYEDAVQFIDKIKEHFPNDDPVFLSFLQIMRMYGKGELVVNDVHTEITALFSSYPDLLAGFVKFLPDNPPQIRTGKQHQRDRTVTSNPDENTMVKLQKDKRNSAGIEAGKRRNPDQDIRQSEHASNRQFDMQNDHEKIGSSQRVDDEDTIRNSSCAKGAKKVKILLNGKPVKKSLFEKDDFSGYERCTPSYVLLPSDYPIASASGRADLEPVVAEVLNDKLVLVTSGSEDFRHRQRNKHEMILFKCEDDKFELEMRIESTKSTANRCEELLNNDTISLDNLFHAEDHFTAMQLRCIEHLYGDHGLDVIEELSQNPSVVLPIILSRLKKKQEEWNKCLPELNEVWADVYAKNLIQALDDRGFCFKQQDSKTLSTRALLAEIKQNKEKKMKKIDAVILAISPGSRHPLCPHLEFEYADNEIHEDVYKIIKYSCEEVCKSNKEFEKMIKLWTTFLEPMLGVPSRPSSSSGSAGTESVGPFEYEKEEGELSPSIDYEVDNLAVDEDDNCDQDARRENEVDADDEDSEYNPKREDFLARPLVKNVPSMLAGNEMKSSRVFYGNDDFYVLFRLHQVLYDRILAARRNSGDPDLYGRFINALYSLLDGSTSCTEFEAECRDTIGKESYMLLTLDKLISKLVKQLQLICGDNTDNNLLQLFDYENSRTWEEFVDYVYYENVHVFLSSKNIYRIECSLAPCHLSIQLMDDSNYKPSMVGVSMDQKFSDYLHNEYLTVVPSQKETCNIFLERTKRKYQDLDESSALCKALEDVHMVNGLEYESSSRSSKISYVLHTEDFFYRKKKQRASSTGDQSRVESFQSFLDKRYANSA